MKTSLLYTPIRLAERLLPSPFSIAILLTLGCFVAAGFFTPVKDAMSLVNYWKGGVWSLLGFGMQMMLMLVLGHALALSPFISRILDRNLTYICPNGAQAAVWVTVLSLLAGLINWGLGLIFGAVLARKVAEYATERRIPINYPILAAGAYTSMMIWHSGLSGSAPLTVAGSGHSLEAVVGLIPLSETIFSFSNIVLCAGALLFLPWASFLMAKNEHMSVPHIEKASDFNNPLRAAGAEKLDQNSWFKWILVCLIAVASWQGFVASEAWYRYLSLDSMNLILFGMAIAFHPSIQSFLRAVDRAIGSASGILIQFPLYAGIMGVMKESGLIGVMADAFVQMSSPATFPVFSLLGSGLVNLLVPSGGGQWQVQGPVLIEAAIQLNVPVSKAVMALSYGDQLTNMLQPFWALPLLGITGLKPAQLFRYSLVFFLIGLIWFSILLSVF